MGAHLPDHTHTALAAHHLPSGRITLQSDDSGDGNVWLQIAAFVQNGQQAFNRRQGDGVVEVPVLLSQDRGCLSHQLSVQGIVDGPPQEGVREVGHRGHGGLGPRPTSPRRPN
ncbi:hypothetical protein ACIRP7_27240 [Streptomyces sp. NPDC102270]|uniref:hypothetical protein n=1 Tax=Streptomyces sp. NPDC102270 TaxID=3366150 RepID=UPI00381A0B56